jgi:hypothetical protein
MSAPNQNNEIKIHPQQIMIKLMLDSQNNINKLVAMQEQQMVYINTLFKQIINDESTNTNAPSTGSTATSETSNSTTAAVSTKQGTIKSKPNQSTHNQSVTEENKTL